MALKNDSTSSTCFGAGRERYPGIAQLFDSSSATSDVVEDVVIDSKILCDSHVNSSNRHLRFRSQNNRLFSCSLADENGDGFPSTNAQPLSPSAFISNNDYKLQHDREGRGEMLNFDNLDCYSESQRENAADDFFANKENVRSNKNKTTLCNHH